MDNNDRQAIDGLFGKLSNVERQAGPRDDEAEALIRDRVAAQPAAPYFMAQTIVVQDQALNAAQQRIDELEQQLATRPAASGGLFSGLFGGNAPAAPRAMPNRPHASANAGPWGQQSEGIGHAQRGGGFLAGAAQTAMGVAGGVLLGNAIAGMFSGNEANAAENSSAHEQDAGGDDALGDIEF